MNIKDCAMHVDATVVDSIADVEEDTENNKKDSGLNNTDVEITDFHPGTVDNPFIKNGTPQQLEKFLLTCVFVAGKNASVMQKKVDLFEECVRRDIGSFTVNELGIISAIHNSYNKEEAREKIAFWLQEVKSGQYGRIANCIMSLCEGVGGGIIKLKSCTRAKLTGIKGVGLKTASLFLMYTRAQWSGACLDTHILKWMREECKMEDVPLSTPSNRNEYIRLEKLYMDKAASLGKPLADLDFEIWSKYRKQPHVSKEVTAPVQI